MKFHVPDMSCGHCTAAIEKGVRTADPAADTATDLDARTVTVGSTLAAEAIRDAIKTAGYAAEQVK